MQNFADNKDTVAGLLEAHEAVQWSPEAFQFLANISNQKVLGALKKHVDDYMLTRAAPRRVYANHIFASKPPIQAIYPALPVSVQFDPHYGPVLGTSISPSQKRLFLTCSSDGSVRMYDVQETRPVA